MDITKNAYVPLVEAYPIPEHIKAIAGAIRYDLMNGPSYARIPLRFMLDDSFNLAVGLTC